MYSCARCAADKHDPDSPSCMDMLTNEVARRPGLACTNLTSQVDGADVLVRCVYDVADLD